MANCDGNIGELSFVLNGPQTENCQPADLLAGSFLDGTEVTGTPFRHDTATGEWIESPFDKEIEGLMCREGSWSDLDLLRAWHLLRAHEDWGDDQPNVPEKAFEDWCDWRRELAAMIEAAKPAGTLGMIAHLEYLHNDTWGPGWRGQPSALRDMLGAVRDLLAERLPEEEQNRPIERLSEAAKGAAA